jgi:hypothetical protein
MAWIVGLDVGQARDPSALCALKADTALPIPELIYRCRALKRWPLGTSYRAVAADVARIIKTYLKDGCQLALDFTGPGRPVAEDIQHAIYAANARIQAFSAVTITAGQGVTTGTDGTPHVSKLWLTSCFQTVLQNGRLKIATTLPEARTLIREMRVFKMKLTTAGAESFAAQGKDHDDLLMATMLAVWQGEQDSGPWSVPPEPDGRDQSFFSTLCRIDGVFAPAHLAPSDHQARLWRP